MCGGLDFEVLPGWAVVVDWTSCRKVFLLDCAIGFVNLVSAATKHTEAWTGRVVLLCIGAVDRNPCLLLRIRMQIQVSGGTGTAVSDADTGSRLVHRAGDKCGNASRHGDGGMPRLLTCENRNDSRTKRST